MNAQKKTFLEEVAESFRLPAMIGLGLLAVATLGLGTWIAADLLDRVLRAFSAAAQQKASQARDLHALVAAILWFCALSLVGRRLLPSGMLRTGIVAAVGIAGVALFFAAPSTLTLAPLYVPIGILVLVWAITVATATHVPTIALRELSNLLLNPLGYVVLMVFSIVLAILFFGATERLVGASATSALNLAPLLAIFGQADAASRELNFLVIALLIIVPVITMRLVAEEKRSGTEEVLLTTPVREWHIIAGKFAGTFLFYMLMWLVALIPIYLLSLAGELDGWQVVSTMIGMAYIGFGLLGIGTLASAVTKNQLAAAVLTFLGMLVFTFPSFTTISPTSGFGALRTAADYLDLRRHLGWVARGTIDSRTVFLFLSVGLFSLFLAVRALETRRWAGFSLRKALGPVRLLVLVAGFAGLVYSIVRIADYTGERQVAQRVEFREAEAASRKAAEDAAEAARKRIDQPGKGPLFEDAKAIESDKKIGTDPEQKPKSSGGGSGGGQPDTATPSNDSSAPAIRPEWTPARIIQVVGASLVLLILFLAIFARLLSGGLRNQIVFGSNVAVAGVAALTLVVLVNYLANRNHKAVDLTRDRINSLHPEIFAVVDGTLAEGESVEVIALVGRHANAVTRTEMDENIRRDALAELFERYSEALNRPGVARFSFSFVDPEKEPNRRSQIASEFNAGGKNEVIVRYRDRHEVLTDEVLFELKRDPRRVEEYLREWRNNRQRGGWMPEIPRDQSMAIAQAEILLREMGRPNYLRTAVPRPQMQKLLGESIVQLVESGGANLYHTVGHGEKRLDPPRGAADIKREFGGASLFRQTLAQLNFDPWPLAPITGDREIPVRANYLLIAGPTQPFAKEEIERIVKFVEGGGNLIVLTEAGHESGLAPLLETWGLAIANAQVWMASMGRRGRGGLTPTSPFVMSTKFEGTHPITGALAKKQTDSEATRGRRPYPMTFCAICSPVSISEKPEIKEKWTVHSLLQATTERARGAMFIPYAENDLNPTRPPTKEPAEPTGPFDLAVIVEPTDANSAAGKVVVIGDTDFIEDKLQIPMSELEYDISTYTAWENDLFMEELLKYLKKRPTRISSETTAPTPFAFGAKMQQREFASWKRLSKGMLWLALPAFFMLCGIFVFWVRRKS